MNTNYNNEKTQYQGSDNEATQFEETSTSKKKVNNTTSNEEVKSQSSKNAWKRVAAGAGSGLLIGGVATVLMGMKTPDSETEGKTESPNHKEELSHRRSVQADALSGMVIFMVHTLLKNGMV